MLSVNGASISSVISAAINPAPKVRFSISRFQFRRNIGSTKKRKHRLCSPVEYHSPNVLCIVLIRENLQHIAHKLPRNSLFSAPVSNPMTEPRQTEFSALPHPRTQRTFIGIKPTIHRKSVKIRYKNTAGFGHFHIRKIPATSSVTGICQSM